MCLQTDPTRFSITAFLSDQVTLVARQEHISPGAALLRIHELSRDPVGRARLLGIIGEAMRREHNPAEHAKIAALTREMMAWGDSQPSSRTSAQGRTAA